MATVVNAAPSSFERTAGQLLRLALVAIFLLFGVQKFTLFEATGIAPFIVNSPLTSWMSVLGTLGASMVVGSFELLFGVLLAYGLWRPGSPLAIAGAIGSSITYLTTLSFLLTTPDVFAPDGTPVLSANGLFLLKDVVLLAASVVLLAQSLARRRSIGHEHPRSN